MLSSGEYGESIVVADLEAGIGTLTRLEESQIDVTVIVVEPTPRSLDVGRRALAIARERDQGRIIVVLNKVDDSEVDLALVRKELGETETLVVPHDSAVFDADRAGVSLLDFAPDAPATTALTQLADLIACEGND